MMTPEREKEIREKVERERKSGQLIDYLWKNEYDLLAEIDRLNSIILKELTENDELGAEYTYVLLLKEEISRLRKYEKKVSENEKELDQTIK